MPNRSTVSPRKVPQQRRSQALVHAVIEAAVRILISMAKGAVR
jgi:hypothetical protein